jgi:hypothetical protein
VDKVVPTLIIVAILVLAFALMAIGWRSRRRRQTHVAGLAPVPDELGAILFTEDLLYVATTPAEQPLERIAVHGLGFRARAVFTVTRSGIRLDLAGATPGFLSSSALVGVGRASWTIDRVLCHDGLVFVRWTQTDPSGTVVSLDSNFRSADPDALVAAVERIVPASAPTTEGAAA